MKLRHLLGRVVQGARLGDVLTAPMADFETAYGWMLDSVLEKSLNVSTCTIYTAIPFQEPEMRTYAPLAIGAFNGRILELAEERSVPVIRLDTIGTDAEDYAAMSPIEPSSQGGQKIVDGILDVLMTD